MPKRVSIYERAGAIYVIASHQTQAGFWVDDDEVVALASPQPEELVGAVQAALARSREGAPTPPPSANLSAPLMTAAGVTSWKTFTKTAKYVGVRQNGDTIKVTPYKNIGSKDGFDPMPENAASLPSGDSGLAAALVHALEVAD